jgi:putative transposase
LEEYQKAQENHITVIEFSETVCISERTLYYWKKSLDQESSKVVKKKCPPKNKLNALEKKKVISVLLNPEWIDLSPREIYYKLLDEKAEVIASVSTFYRIAKENHILVNRSKTEKGKKLNREKPIVVATKHNEVWSWDVTQVLSTVRTQRYYLYVIIDIWSRYVVGWTLESHEQSEIAIQMWKKALEEQMISGQGLTNHKDNGAIMTSNEMVKFVHDAKMVDSYSRAGVSDDNPFSEGLFRTLKYFRDFPESFEDLDKGREYFKKYIFDYNYAHRHSGIQFLTPASRHYGDECKILNMRNLLLQEFYKNNSHRYSLLPKTFKSIKEVRIN